MNSLLIFYLLIVIATCDGRNDNHCFAYVNQSMMPTVIERINILNGTDYVDVSTPCHSLKGAFTQLEAVFNEKDSVGRFQSPPHAWLAESTISSGKVCFNFKLSLYRTSSRGDQHLINIPADPISHGEAAAKYPILQKYIMPWQKIIPHRVWSPTVVSDICYTMDVGLVPDGRFFCTPNDSNIPIPQSQYTDEMDDKSLEQFVEAMDDIIDHDLVSQHHRMSEFEAHAFFFGHRYYLACIKKRLALSGIALPIWSPDTPIPLLLQGVKRSPQACLASVACENGWFDLPFRTSSIDIIPIPEHLRAHQLCSHFAGDFQKLYAETFPYHSNLHRLLGGSFTNLDSASAPLLYVFHNWIEVEIFARWENCP